ncbi:MAG TPA: alcohol dehydrogenase catalytic domain-containing protein, partial [Planctomycetota bacterium]|nr:alcohol dehydrogenase catalytic domain-containing protein [Planctomycetota bacterium]
MRAVVIDKPGVVVIRDFPEPVPRPGEVVIDVRVCGFCGTDLHIFRGEYLGEYPVRPGHEASGVVSAIGEGVEDFRIGDRVAVEPNIHCGECAMCRSGRGNFCENWTAIGVTLPG